MALPAGVRVRHPQECLLAPAVSRSRDAGLVHEDWLGKPVAFAGANTEADDEDQPEELPAGTKVASVTRIA